MRGGGGVLAINLFSHVRGWLRNLQDWLREDGGKLLLTYGGRALFIIVAAFVVSRIVRMVLRRAARRLRARRATNNVARQRAETLFGLLLDTTKYVIWGAAILLIFNVDAKTVVGAAGLIGIVLGFGMQSLVKDLVSGLFFVFEGQFAVGDVVEVNNVLGTVEEVGLRVVTLRDASGQRRFISYGNINSVNNYTRRCLVYRVNAPVSTEHASTARDALAQTFERFQTEFAAFTAPVKEEALAASGNHHLLRFLISVTPFRRALVEQKLVPYLTMALKESNVPLREGHEISLLLEYADS
jgi:small conductance mechanosensitive channel